MSSCSCQKGLQLAASACTVTYKKARMPTATVAPIATPILPPFVIAVMRYVRNAHGLAYGEKWLTCCYIWARGGWWSRCSSGRRRPSRRRRESRSQQSSSLSWRSGRYEKAVDCCVLVITIGTQTSSSDVVVPWVTVDWEHNEVVIATSIAVKGAATELVDTVVEIEGSGAGCVTTRATNTTSAKKPV